MIMILYKKIDDNYIDNIGYLLFVINKENKEAIINDIYIEEKYRGQKYGTKMMYKIYDFLIENTETTYVSWIDCSDKCFKEDNMYRKIGANYIENIENFNPEMNWILHDRNVRRIRREYLKNNEKRENEIFIIQKE